MHPAVAAKLEALYWSVWDLTSLRLRFTAASLFIAHAAGQLTSRHDFLNFRVNAPLGKTHHFMYADITVINHG